MTLITKEVLSLQTYLNRSIIIVGYDSLCPAFIKENKMEYWKKPNSGKVERIENFEKHPEKLEQLKSKGYIRVQSETDDMAYSEPKKKLFKKKKKSKK